MGLPFKNPSFVTFLGNIKGGAHTTLNPSLRSSGFVHTCKELSNQIAASTFGKKNAPQKDGHRF